MVFNNLSPCDFLCLFDAIFRKEAEWMGWIIEYFIYDRVDPCFRALRITLKIGYTVLSCQLNIIILKYTRNYWR